MRLFDSSMMRLLANEPDLGPEPDTLALLMRRGAKVAEVQVQMRDRVAGESYLTFTRSASYMARISLSILLVQWFRRPFRDWNPKGERRAKVAKAAGATGLGIPGGGASDASVGAAELVGSDVPAAEDGSEVAR